MSTLTHVHVKFAELCQCVDISEEQLLQLVTEGILTPRTGRAPEDWEFDSKSVSLVQKAERIYRDLTIEWGDMPLILDLLEEVQHLRTENTYLRQRLSRFLQDE